MVERFEAGGIEVKCSVAMQKKDGSLHSGQVNPNQPRLLTVRAWGVIGCVRIFFQKLIESCLYVRFSRPCIHFCSRRTCVTFVIFDKTSPRSTSAQGIRSKKKVTRVDTLYNSPKCPVYFRAISTASSFLRKRIVSGQRLRNRKSAPRKRNLS